MLPLGRLKCFSHTPRTGFTALSFYTSAVCNKYLVSFPPPPASRWYTSGGMFTGRNSCFLSVCNFSHIGLSKHCISHPSDSFGIR